MSASTPPAALLEMHAISKRFGGVLALDAVSLSVARGEVVGLIGENGAGKSTLLKALGGVHAPDAGEVRVDGAPACIRSAREAARLGVAFIHQELNVLDNLDVAANVFLGREPTKNGKLRLLDQAVMEERTKQYLQQIGLALAPRTPAARLSLAQRQMVEIARALGQEARLIIMDEPTSSLTPTETGRLLSVIKDLRARGVSVVYVSHRLSEIQTIADRVVALRDGKNAGALTREEMEGPVGHDRMVRLMVGRDLVRAPVAAAAPLPASPTGPPRLEARGLRTPRYPDHAVSFALRAGEIVGLAGLVGAGRTEIAQALFGVAPALAGQIVLDGKSVGRIASAGAAIAHGIFLVPEDRRRSGLLLDLTIKENVSLPGLSRFATAWGWVRRGVEREAAQAACASVGIKSAAIRAATSANATAAALLDAPAGALSGGNQQKVVLAKWLALRPRVLIFDEPTRGIDVGAKAEIYAIIRGLAQNGVAVLLISSDLEEVLSLSDRILVLHEGQIKGALNKRAGFSEEAVMRLAVGGGASVGESIS